MSAILIALAAALGHPETSESAGKCTADEAQRVTIEEIIAAGEAWLGRCVSVSGRGSGQSLRSWDNLNVAIEVDVSDLAQVTHTLVGRVARCIRRSHADRAARSARSGPCPSPSVVMLDVEEAWVEH